MPEITQKRTDELTAGDRVVIGNGRIVRTVKTAEPNGYVNRRNEPLWTVLYVEPTIPGVWSDGNSANQSGLWTVEVPA